jgi:hypothetical protein
VSLAKARASGFVNGRKEAKKFVGNQPIFVSIGAACVFETKLATIDLPEVSQRVSRRPVRSRRQAARDISTRTPTGGRSHCALWPADPTGNAASNLSCPKGLSPN